MTTHGPVLGPPRPVRGEVPRPALLALLGGPAAALQVVGPDGLGKRTALAAWARTQACAAWLCPRVRHADTVQLLSDLAAAVRAAGVNTPASDRAALLGGVREDLAFALIADLHAHGTGVTLCVEDAGRLTDDAARLLAAVFTQWPPGSRLRLTSGRDLRPLLLPFLPEEDVASVTGACLHFTPGEWAALPPGPFPSVDGTLRDADAGQRIAALDPADQRRLVVAAAQGGMAAPDLTARLLAASLPVHDREGGATLHPLLTAHVAAQHDGTAVWNAAAWSAAHDAERHGLLLNAALLHLRGHNLPAAVPLLEALAPRWAEQLDWPLVRFALEAAPAGALSPALLALLANARMETGDGQGGDDLAATLNLPAALLVRAEHARRTGNQSGMQAFVAQGLACATDQRDIVGLLIQAGLVGAETRGAADPSQADVQAAFRALQEALDRARAIGDPALQTLATLTRGYVLRRLGHSGAAREALEAAFQMARQLNLTRRTAQAMELLCDLHLQEDRLAEARQVMEEGLNTTIITDPALLGRVQALQVELHALSGRPAEALALAERTFHLSQGAGDLLAARYVALYLVPALAVRGDVDRAGRFAGLLHDRLDWRQLPLFTHAYHVFQAYLAAGGGDEAGARTHLAQAPVLTGRDLSSITGTLARVLEWRLQPPNDAAALPDWLPEARRMAALQLVRAWLPPDPAGAAETERDLESPALGLHVTTLGARHVTLGGQRVAVPGRALEALVYRLFHPQARQDELAAQVWPDAPLKQARVSASVARNTLNRVLRDAAAGAGRPDLGDVVTGGRRGQRNPAWVLHPDVVVSSDVQTLLGTVDAATVATLNRGAFLTGCDHEWVEDVQARIDAHVRAVELLQGRDPGARPAGDQ